MLGEGPLYFIALPIVAALYFGGFFIAVSILNSGKTSPRHQWIIDLLFSIILSPIAAIGLWHYARASNNTSWGNPLFLLLTIPTLLGVLLGIPVGVMKRGFNKTIEKSRKDKEQPMGSGP